MAKKQTRGRGEGSLTQRSNGRWRAQVSQNGKRLSFGADTKKECAEWLRKILHQVDYGLDLEGGRIKVGEYLKDWHENSQPSLRAKTSYQYGKIIEKHILPFIGELPLKALTPQRVEQFYGQMLKKGSGVRTVRYAHGVLHKALEKAVRYGLIAGNPSHGASLPQLHQKEMQVFDESQVSTFLTASSGSRLEALFYLAVVTGMREGEIFGLKWVDLQWNNGVLHVQRQVQRVPGQSWAFVEPKTRAGRRMVSIGNGAIEALRRQKERQAQERAIAGKRWQDLDLIFPSAIGTPMDPHNLMKDFNAVLGQAGLPKIRFHDLRHTAASLMLNHGVPVLVVSKMLGHANPSITLNTYAHLYHESLSGAAKLMDELVTPLRIEMTPPLISLELVDAQKAVGKDLHQSAPTKRA
jgi:integrase